MDMTVSDLSEQMKAFNPSAVMSVSASLPALPGLSLLIDPTSAGTLVPMSGRGTHKGKSSELQALRSGLDTVTAGRKKSCASQVNSVPEVLTSLRGTKVTAMRIQDEDSGPTLKLEEKR